METRVVNLRTWRGPVVRIDRTTVFGNPFRLGLDGDRTEVIRKYEAYFRDRVQKDPKFRAAVEGLRGKVLGCWCKPAACHGDILVDWLERR